jgi:hypothetical protein
VNSRVRSLDLRIRASDRHAREESISFARSVLQRADEELERRAPGRVVLLRTLETKWRLLRGALSQPNEIEAVAGELSNWLDDRAEVLQGTSKAFGADEECAVFCDEAEWRVQHLSAISRAQHPWWGRTLEEEGPPPGALLRGHEPVLLAEVLARLARRGEIVRVCRALDDGSVQRLLALDPIAGHEQRIVLPSPEAVPRELLPAWTRAALTQMSARDDIPRRRLAIVAVALALEGGPERTAIASPLMATLVSLTRESIESGRPRRRTVSSSGDGGAVQETAAPGVSAGPDSGEPIADAAPATDPHEVASRFGGLIYLATLLVELRAGELLWTACLDEPPVLSAALSLLLDGAEDPAPEEFGGAPPSPVPEIGDAAQREITDALLAEIAAAFPRRGFGRTPRVQLIRDRSGDLLAVMEGTPFVIFAWPGGAAQEVTSGLQRFLARWPHAAPRPLAMPALAELDSSGRLEASRNPVTAALPEGLPPPARRLVGQIAGSVAALFSARLARVDGRGPALAASISEFRDRWLAIPARIARWDETLEVHMPMDRIEIDVRRAALDRDPHWLAWLRADAKIVFEEQISTPLA